MWKPRIYYHVFCADDWKKMLQEQVLKLYSSGILSESQFLCFSLSGYSKEDADWVKSIAFNIDNARVHLIPRELWDIQERGTLLNMHNECGSHLDGDWPILYMHMKGLTKSSYNSDMWRLLMEHFNITEWKKALKKLENGFLAYGVNLRDDTEEHFHKRYLHYSGNMWWSRAEHVRSLDKNFILDNSDWLKRWNSEFWIGTNGDRDKFYCVHESGVDHYKDPYEIMKYLSLKRLEI